MDNVFNVDVLDQKNVQTSTDFISDIIPEIEAILKYSFPESKHKQTIRIHGTNRINFACPLCGDSGTDEHKKRGNIILDSGRFQNMYKCHNCGAYMSIDKFFRHFNKNLSLGSIEYIASNKQTFDIIQQDSSMNLLFDIDNIEKYCITRDYLKEKLNLIEISNNNDAGIYLSKRNQYNWQNFLFDNVSKTLYLLNLTPNGFILGAQLKPFKVSKNEPKYKTYKLSNMYSMLLHEDKEIPEDVDTLSMFFNILLINYSKPIIAVEGPMDSFLIKNSIATCGASKSIPIDLQFYYMFDDDNTGRDYAFKKLNNGEFVFLWDKFKHHLGLPYRGKWDYNDVINYCKSNNIKVPHLYEFFSNDTFDIIDI